MNNGQKYNKEQLQKDLELKITNTFKKDGAFFEYIGQTLKNFAFRYIPTNEDSNLKLIKEGDLFCVESYETNMGNAFKIIDIDAKEGIKKLAKTIPMNEKPKVRYRLGVFIEELNSDSGKMTVFSEVHWGFPGFSDKNMKQKTISFKFEDLHDFRKNLALKFEDVADLFS